MLNPINHGGGRIPPMAQKFRNSSNSEEFGTLALLDFSLFVIMKPYRPDLSKSNHSEPNESHFVDSR